MSWTCSNLDEDLVDLGSAGLLDCFFLGLFVFCFVGFLFFLSLLAPIFSTLITAYSFGDLSSKFVCSTDIFCASLYPAIRLTLGEVTICSDTPDTRWASVTSGAEAEEIIGTSIPFLRFSADLVKAETGTIPSYRSSFSWFSYVF